MIKQDDAYIEEFLDVIKGKKLYCYGAGKVFDDFLRMYPDITICAVIDKRARKLNYKLDKIRYITLEEFLEECDAKESILLITCLDYLNIQKKLSSVEYFKNLRCYVYYIMQEKKGIIPNEGTNKYQLLEFRFQDYMAGQKAPSDTAIIASEMGYEVITLNRGTLANGMEQTEQSWKYIADRLDYNSNLILQLPLADDTEGVYRILAMKNRKNVRIIGIIHDINIFRGNPTDYDFRQYKVLKELPDVLIVHNKHMMRELADRGFDINRMVNLKIFDYLIPNYEKIGMSEGIVIAGNLVESKAAYVYKLNKIKGVTFNLFGANYIEENSYDNIYYFGTFLPDELVKNIQGKYGLVWDGDSIETCSGGKGEYLRINNPHKLSLYLAVGLPVIIWEEAAEAEFVLNEHVGITVKSLYELPDKLESMSENDYEVMKKNAAMVGERLRKGMYMTNAIKEAENKINEMETKNGV